MHVKYPLICFIVSLLSYASLSAQKKPLDHTVYDGWQSIPEKWISNNGQYIAYTINPQQGDGVLVIRLANGKELLQVNRGYAARFSVDSRYAVCKIKPLYADTREARIRKKKLADMPKDSLAIINLDNAEVLKVFSVESYKMPEEAGSWVAYLAEKTAPPMPTIAKPDSVTLIRGLTRVADSLMRLADSLKQKLAEVRVNGLTVLEPEKKITKDSQPLESGEEERGSLLTLKSLQNGSEYRFTNITSYEFDKKGKVLMMVAARKKGNPSAKGYVIWYTLATGKQDTIMAGLNEVKNITFDGNGNQAAFVAERDSSIKAVQKFYKLWYYRPGMDSAEMLADRSVAGLAANRKVSEDASLLFSRNGTRVFFGTTRILPPKDTTLPEFERVNIDIWNYKDDNLQTAQLFNLNKDLQLNYLAVYDLEKKQIVQIGDDTLLIVPPSGEKDPVMFYGSSRVGKMVASQWQGFSLEDIYAIDAFSGKPERIVKDFKGKVFPSATGKYLLMYNERKKNYFIYNAATGLVCQAASLKYPLYDEDNDMPDDPEAYGVMGWTKDDKSVYVYDRYDIWQIDPENKTRPVMFNTSGRAARLRTRYIKTDKDEKWLDPVKNLCFERFSEVTKMNSYVATSLSSWSPFALTPEGPYSFADAGRAKDADVYIYTKESYQNSPDLYVTLPRTAAAAMPEGREGIRLTSINAQQSLYTWGTAELYKWKAYTGRMAEGILYKPENFDAKKKYPMILYFYERNSEHLYNYIAPVPTPSRLNISFYVSRGYVIFVPDIWYTTGHPGKSAYDYIVSATKALIKEGFVDSANIGIQGQSWGGYQALQVITMTNLYKAAWTGAPVVNMFSAYGGIRWESGLNRQFQYERTQSRIGATIWEKPELYTENSPLFHLPNIKTPLVIMSNDADGAVPWYQGIELFTAMRRLNKPVWLLNYNGEAHNLMERKNRKDIQIREQQFFDWMLKGEKPAPWITEGVPGIMKGRTMGL